MAKATFITVPSVQSVTLSLSVEEAQAMLAVLSVVGGSPRLSRRCYTDNIRSALISEGINSEIPATDLENYSRVYFKAVA